MKQRIRDMILGSILTVILLGTVTVLANSVTRDISVTFRGIRLVVNNELITPRDADGNVVEPFIWEGTTYLPVRAVAEALNQDVFWDGDTSTVYLLDRLQTTPALEPDVWAAPSPVAFFEAISAFERGGNHAARHLSTGTVNMLGSPYPNSLHMNFQRTGIGQWEAWWNFNLGSQFETLTGTIGRRDGTGEGANSISFIGDGVTLASFIVDGDTLPTSISIDVRGVRILRIQFDESIRNAGVVFTNAMIE